VLTPNAAQNHSASGVVTFMSGTTVVGTASVVNGTATLTTTKLPGGTDSVIASYPGDTNFSASSSSAITIPVTPVDFSLSLASPTLTIPTGHHLTTAVTLASINGFSDSITITCVKPPTNITCQFTPAPATLAANGTTNVSFYIDTDSVLGFARNDDPPMPLRPLVPPVGVALWAAIAVCRRRANRLRVRVLLLALAAVPVALSLSGCGEIILGPPAVPPGTYMIPVAATSPMYSVTHTAQLTLTVTP
jgi:large repetitive protein